jgi:hypothetical protein
MGDETDELFIDTEFTAIKATVLEMATGSFRDMFTIPTLQNKPTG